jgi:hypothetical protein
VAPSLHAAATVTSGVPGCGSSAPPETDRSARTGGESAEQVGHMPEAKAAQQAGHDLGVVPLRARNGGLTWGTACIRLLSF